MVTECAKQVMTTMTIVVRTRSIRLNGIKVQAPSTKTDPMINVANRSIGMHPTYLPNYSGTPWPAKKCTGKQCGTNVVTVVTMTMTKRQARPRRSGINDSIGTLANKLSTLTHSYLTLRLFVRLSLNYRSSYWPRYYPVAPSLIWSLVWF